MSDTPSKRVPVRGRGFESYGGGFAEILVGQKVYAAADIVEAVRLLDAYRKGKIKLADTARTSAAMRD